MPLILLWVIIGTLTMLAYIAFFVNIDSRWADHFIGYPLVYAFTVFLWPVTACWMLWSWLGPAASSVQRR